MIPADILALMASELPADRLQAVQRLEHLLSDGGGQPAVADAVWRALESLKTDGTRRVARAAGKTLQRLQRGAAAAGHEPGGQGAAGSRTLRVAALSVAVAAWAGVGVLWVFRARYPPASPDTVGAGPSAANFRSPTAAVSGSAGPGQADPAATQAMKLSVEQTSRSAQSAGSAAAASAGSGHAHPVVHEGSPKPVTKPGAEPLSRCDDDFQGTHGSARDEREAARCYSAAAENGNAHAQVRLGTLYLYARGGRPQDDVQAIHWFRKAADQGDARGEAELALMYMHGRGGLPQDSRAAESWARKSADHGDPLGQLFLATLYDEGLGGLRSDKSEVGRLAGSAFPQLRSLADQGDAEAQFRLGTIYLSGLGGQRQDAVLAVSWFRTAANQDDPLALAELCTLYASGLGGIPQDDVQAVNCFRKAVLHGVSIAEAGLGSMYAKGRGGLVQDEAQAVSWWKKAAEHGDAGAMYELGLLYERGSPTVAQDAAAAYRLLTNAARQGLKAAQEHLKTKGVQW